MTEELFPLHTRVALKDGADNVYLLALAGTEGWVRGHREDDDGFRMVAIEWDKEHWRYNGQPDGWSFADHFKAIGPPESPQEAPEMSEDELPEPRPLDDDVDEYIEQISQAMEAASESDGFFMLAIRRMPNPSNPRETLFVPQVFTEALTQEAEVLLDVQLMECANASYQQVALNLLERLKGGD